QWTPPQLGSRHVAFLGKPFKQEQLISALQALIAEAEHEKTSQAEAGANRPARSVLIIDSDGTIVDSYADVFTREGFRVLTAATGQDGVRQAVTFRPAVVITESRLSDMDALSVLRLLRRSPARDAAVT